MKSNKVRLHVGKAIYSLQAFLNIQKSHYFTYDASTSIPVSEFEWCAACIELFQCTPSNTFSYKNCN